MLNKSRTAVLAFLIAVVVFGAIGWMTRPDKSCGQLNKIRATQEGATPKPCK